MIVTFLEAGARGGLGGGNSKGYPTGGCGWGGGRRGGEANLLPNPFQQLLLLAVALGHTDELARRLGEALYGVGDFPRLL